MEEQKQPFRFRLPWLAQPPQQPGPTVENPRTPSQSTTSVPIRRPSTKPTSQSASSQTTNNINTSSNSNNNKPPSLSFVAIKTLDPDSQSASSKSVAISRPTEKPLPSRSAYDSPKTTQQASTKPPSPVRPQSKVVSSPTPSPSKGDARSKTSISPPTPSRRLSTPQKTTAKTASKEAETTITIKSQPLNRVNSEPNPGSSQSQVPEPKVEIKSEATANEVVPSHKRPNSGAQESPEEEKSNKADYEEVTEKPGSENTGALRSQENRENFSERKETLSTTGDISKQLKTVSPSKPAFRSSAAEVAPRQREIKEDISKLVLNLTTGPQLDANHVGVVTLTGENCGASMVLSSEQAKKEALIHIHRGYKADPDDSLRSTAEGEEPTNRKKKLDDKAGTTPAALAYVNSNVQSINNSIIVEASVPGRNPGVHLVFSQKTFPEALKVNENKSKLVDTHKAEFTATHAERLTHEPNVRRRCLRGLFMESSDSEPDNTNKPRRHGCRYSCGVKGKDKDLM